MVLRTWAALLSVTGMLAHMPACQAQSAPLTMDQCVELALKQNSELQLARNNVQTARIREQAALSGYLPRISAQYTVLNDYNRSGPNSNDTGTTLTVEHTLYDGGLREAGIQRTRHQLLNTQAGRTGTEHSIRLQTIQAYIEALRARELHAVALSSKQYITQLRDQVRARAEQGLSATADVLPVEAQLASADVSLVSARTSMQSRLIDLQITIGLTPDAGFDIQGLDMGGTQDVPSLTEALSSAKAHRPDLREALEAAAASRWAVREAEINLYPRPVVSLAYVRRDLSSGKSEERQIRAAIQLSTLDGGVSLAAAREAQVSRSSAELRIQQTERRIHAEVEQALLDLTSAVKRVEAAEVSVQAATQSYSAQVERYHQGLNSIVDVLNAETQLTSAQSSRIQALYDLFLARTQLAYATGTIGELP